MLVKLVDYLAYLSVFSMKNVLRYSFQYTCLIFFVLATPWYDDTKGVSTE